MNRHVLRNVFWGLVLIGLGIIFILFLFGIFDFEFINQGGIKQFIKTYYPVLVIVAGLVHLVSGRKKFGSVIGGMVIAALGIYLLMRNLGVILVEYRDLWKFLVPAVLIGAGLGFLLNPKLRVGQRDRKETKEYNKNYNWEGENFDYHPPYENSQSSGPASSFKDWVQEGKEKIKDWKNSDDEDWKNDWKKDWQKDWNHQNPDYDPMFASNPKKTEKKSGFIGDIRIEGDYWELNPMDISYFIGDTKIDLTKAMIPYGQTDINISAFIGDVKIFLPNDVDLEVKVKATSVIGDIKIMGNKEEGLMRNVDYQTPFYGDGLKQIVIHIHLFIGDVIVKKVG